jgi:signal recognition particle subunit SRP54
LIYKNKKRTISQKMMKMMHKLGPKGLLKGMGGLGGLGKGMMPFR